MATTYSVDLAFSAKTRELDAAVSKLNGFDRTANKLKGKNPFEGVERGAKGAGTAVDGLGRKSKAAQGAMSGLIALAGRLTAAFSAATLAQKAFNAGVGRIESERRLTALADVYGEVGAAQEAASRAARKFGLSQTEANQSFAQIYARLRPIGTSLKEIETAYNGFNTAAKLSGASVSEASSAWLQLSQALGSGVLRGEELNSVFEQTPGVVQAIAKEMGAPIGQIRQLAQDGKITSDIVIRALRRIETEGADKLATALGGPQQKIKNLENAFENFGVAVTRDIVPAIAKALNGLAGLINNLSNALDTLTGKSLGADLMKRVSKGNAAGLLGARSEQLDQYERVLGLLNTPQKNRGGLIAQLQTARELSGRLRGIRATGNPEADARIVQLQGMAMGLIKTFEGLIQGLDKAAKDAASAAITPTPTPLQTKLDKDTEKLKGLQGRYIQGGYGPGGPNAYGPHFDIKRVDGSYFSRSELDRYVQVNGKPLSSGVTVPGGQFGAMRDGGSRVHNAWDYAFSGSAALSLKGGAQWKGVQGGSYGDAAVFVTPDGKAYRIIHGKFERTGSDGSSMADTVNDQLNAELEAMKVREESLQAGRELMQQFERELAIRTAITPLEREILQIKYDTADRQVQIDALLDKEQQTILTLLNTDLERLRVLEAQVKAFYDQADAAGVLAEKMQGIGGKAFGGSASGVNGFAPGMPNLNPGSGSGDKLGEQFTKVKQELADLQNPVNQITAGAQAIGSAFGTAFKDVASGAKTAEQALADAFQSIGNHFLDMASQMIAKWIEMQIIGLATSLLGGLGSATGAAASGGYKLPSGGGFAQGFSMPPMFEGGGYTGNAPRAGGLDGKGGFPAILHPGETVTDHRSSSARAALKEGGGGGGGTITIESRVINSVEYVTLDQARQMSDEAASLGAKRGGALGERRTLDRLRQSPKTRRSLGL